MAYTQKQALLRVFRIVLSVLVAVVSLIGAFFLICIALAKAMQQQGVRDRIRHFNQSKLNPITLKIAGSRSRIYASLQHVGRHSGRTYSTPVVAKPFSDGFVIPLPYGPDVDWCKNIMASGNCILRWDEQDFSLEKPEIIPLPDAQGAYPWAQRFIFSAGGIKQCLLLHKQIVSQEKPEGIEKVVL